jgi:hypothetical protein
VKEHACEHESDYPAVLHMYRSIQDEFPNVHMDIDAQEVNLHIPRQNGVLFPIKVENNSCELLIYVDGRYLMWGGIGEGNVNESCRQAVTGLLSGTHRAVQYFLGRWCVRTEIQRQVGADWEKVYGQGVSPGIGSLRVLQNRDARLIPD